MQVVAVTDPLELGFARQAMVGIRVSGPLEPVADAHRRARRGRLRRRHRRLLRPPRRGRLRERRAPARADLRPDPGDRRRRWRPRRSCTSACASRPTRGACAEAGGPIPGGTRTGSGSRSGTTRVETDWTPRPALSGDVDADVAIVGAGFTGLWTAYYLAEADPSLRIVVLEAETAGYGASGRNGGWCSALFPASLPTLAGLADREAALAQHRAMRATVDEVVRVAAAEGIDADVAKGGTIALARSRAQWRRARAEVAEARAWDRGEDDVRLLDRPEATADPARQPDRRRDVHPRLRRDPPGPPGPRTGGRGRAARRDHPRADPGPLDRAGSRARPPTAWSARGRCCARPRATPRRWRARAGRWSPSTH